MFSFLLSYLSLSSCLCFFHIAFYFGCLSFLSFFALLLFFSDKTFCPFFLFSFCVLLSPIFSFFYVWILLFVVFILNYLCMSFSRFRTCIPIQYLLCLFSIFKIFSSNSYSIKYLPSSLMHPLSFFLSSFIISFFFILASFTFFSLSCPRA